MWLGSSVDSVEMAPVAMLTLALVGLANLHMSIPNNSPLGH